MLNSGRIVNQMLRVQRGEGCLVIYGLVASFKAEMRKVNVGDVWFRVSLLCLFLRAGVSSLLVSSTFFCSAPLSRNLSFISLFSSDQIKLGFFVFLLRRLRIGWKITFNYFYFLTNFIDISLCAETPFFLLKIVSAPITSGEYSRRR